MRARSEAVFPLALSPVGEVRVAVPAGLAMGLPGPAVLGLATAGNALPALGRVGLHGLARRRVRRWLDRWGLGLALVAPPWLGAYPAVSSLLVLGMAPFRVLAGALASLLLQAVALLALAQAGDPPVRGAVG